MMNWFEILLNKKYIEIVIQIRSVNTKQITNLMFKFSHLKHVSDFLLNILPISDVNSSTRYKWTNGNHALFSTTATARPITPIIGPRGANRWASGCS